MKSKIFILYFTLAISIIVQIITGIIEIWSFFVKVPTIYFLISQLLLIELVFQFFEGMFYFWLFGWNENYSCFAWSIFRIYTIFNLLFWYFFFFWSLYGVVAVLPYYVKNSFYNILDLFAKNFFGIFLSYIIFSGNYWNIINVKRCKTIYKLYYTF